MRKLLLLIFSLCLFATLKGQIIRAQPFARASSALTFDEVMADGNTLGRYIADADYITIETEVQIWADSSSAGNNLVNNTDAEQPAWDSANGEIDFNGTGTTADNLQNTEVRNQPWSFYAVVRINTNASKTMLYWNVGSNVVAVNTVTNRLTLNSGAALTINNAATGSYGIVSGIVNGASSLLQWNNETASTGDAGATTMGVIRVGAGSNSLEFSIKEYIVRLGADSEATRTIIKNELNSRHSVY